MQKVLTIQGIIDRLPDPRQRGKVVYPIGEVMPSCLCGVISVARVLSLKGNQGTLYEDVKLWFEEAGLSGCSHIETVDADKGRHETRNYWITDDIECLKDRHPGWEGFASIGMVKSRREIDGKVTEQKRLFIASIPASATSLSHAVRSHWGIENKLHWVLDMIFRDDEARVRKDHGPKNFTAIKHMAINMVRAAKTKQSIRVMRKEAGWNNQILRDIMRK